MLNIANLCLDRQLDKEIGGGSSDSTKVFVWCTLEVNYVQVYSSSPVQCQELQIGIPTAAASFPFPAVCGDRCNTSTPITMICFFKALLIASLQLAFCCVQEEAGVNEIRGDVRLQVYLHRMKRSSATSATLPEPSAEKDELLGYLWFHTAFVAEQRIESMGSVRGAEFKRAEIDVKLKRAEACPELLVRFLFR